MASQSSSFGIIGVGYSRLSIQTRIAISLINDEDDDNFNEMLVQYIVEEGLFYERHLPRPCRTRPFTGHALIQDILAGHEDRGYDLFRMSNQAFFLLRDELVALDAIRPTRWLGCDEQLAIFLNGIGHGVSNRVLAEMFQHSGETISRHFNNVLNAVLKLRSEYIKLPNALTRTHPRISSNPAFHPYFKNALGAIDGTHIPAIVREHKHARYRCRKNFISQNVMAAVSFDHTFMYVSSGWEGSAADMKVLRWALESGGFSVPEGKYYLVDSGYANTLRFLAPYRGIRYHLSEYRTQRRRGYRSPRDKYNHHHAQLRNAVEKTFGILKRRFKILRYAVPYPFRTQAKLVLACCIIHNFIARHQGNDRYFNLLNGLESWDSDDDDDEELDPTIVVGLDESRRGDHLRAWITNQMAND